MIVFAACILTVVIETAFMYLFGYRTRNIITVIVFANVLTNLLLNLMIILFFITDSTAVILLEIVVVISEYHIYAHFEGHSKKLFVLTLAANVITYVTGLLLF